MWTDPTLDLSPRFLFFDFIDQPLMSSPSPLNVLSRRMGSSDFWNADYMFFPVHKSEHWSLVIVSRLHVSPFPGLFFLFSFSFFFFFFFLLTIKQVAL